MQLAFCICGLPTLDQKLCRYLLKKKSKEKQFKHMLFKDQLYIFKLNQNVCITV